MKLVNRDLYAKKIKNDLYQSNFFREKLKRQTYVSKVKCLAWACTSKTPSFVEFIMWN